MDKELTPFQKEWEKDAAVAYYGEDAVREGWFVRYPDGKVDWIHGPTICVSSGGGQIHALDKLRQMGWTGKVVFEPASEHLDVNANPCNCSGRRETVTLWTSNLTVDLSALVVRLTRAIKVRDPNNKVAQQAMSYLERNQLLGSALRTPETRLHRTLIRVQYLGNNNIVVIIPAWDPNNAVKINYDDIPINIKEKLEPGYRFHARVNIGAESASELTFSDFEEL